MDPQRLKDAYQKLQSLDDRLTWRIRPRAGGPLVRPAPEQLEQAMRELAAYTIELKEVVEELFQAIAGKPSAGAGGGAGPGAGPGGAGSGAGRGPGAASGSGEEEKART